MGAGGRAPKPTPLKVLQGVRPNRINDDEPVPVSDIPECPSRHRDVRAVWDYTIEQLRVMGVVTLVDRDALHAYCEAVVAFREACDTIEREGPIITGARGGLIRHPACAIQKENAMLMKSYAVQFGLTPSARTSIRVGDSKVKPREQGAARLLTG